VRFAAAVYLKHDKMLEVHANLSKGSKGTDE